MNRILINDGKKIVKTALSDRNSSLIQNEISTCNINNIPKQTCKDIDNIITSKKHEVYGSLAQTSHSYCSRMPADVDVAVPNPKETANEILYAMRKKGIRSKIDLRKPQVHPNSYSVKINRNNKWETIADVNPIDEHEKDSKHFAGYKTRPEHIGNFCVQGVRDQLIRKGDTSFSHKTKTERKLKDKVDFILLANLRLKEKQLQAEAELERVRVAKEKLEQIKQHVRKDNRWNAKEYPLNKEPIPDRQKKQFINFAVKHPNVDARNIILQNGKVKTSTQKKKKAHNNIFDPQNQAYKFWL